MFADWPLGNAGYPAAVVEMVDLQATARKLGLETIMPEVRRAEDVAPAIEQLKGRVDALYVSADPLISTNQVRINTLALAAQLPTMHGSRYYVESGGLISYGPNYERCFAAPVTMLTRFCTAPSRAIFPSNSQPNSSSL